MELIYAPSSWLTKQVKPFDFDTTDAIQTAQEMVDLMDLHKGLVILI